MRFLLPWDIGAPGSQAFRHRLNHTICFLALSYLSICLTIIYLPTFQNSKPLSIYKFEEISSLSHSGVFLYFFALIAEEGFLISP